MKNNRLTNVEVKELTLIADRIKDLASLKRAFFGKDEDSDKKIKEEIRLYMTWFDLQADKINRILNN